MVTVDASVLVAAGAGDDPAGPESTAFLQAVLAPDMPSIGQHTARADVRDRGAGGRTAEGDNVSTPIMGDRISPDQQLTSLLTTWSYSS